MRVIVGIDEAGRGPLAGPVSVAAAAVPLGFDVLKEFPGVADSKILSEKKREQIFEMLCIRITTGDVRIAVEFSDSEYIDANGITKAVENALTRAIGAVAPYPKDTTVVLDGLLSAPSMYINQTTIIHGDAIEPIISLASIAAKVKRDHLMKEIDAEYPIYGFARHKGYGTKAHRTIIANYGPCPIHRRTFLHGYTNIKSCAYRR